MRAHVVRGADAAALVAGIARRRDELGRAIPAQALKRLPQMRAAGPRVLCHQRVDREEEELEAFLPTTDRLGAIGVDRERRHRREVGVHGMAERHALVALDRVVVDGAPRARLVRVDEGECQRAETVPRCHPDRVAIGARHPHRRMRLLERLRDHVAARHREAGALVPGVGVEHHHVGDLRGGFERERAFLFGGDLEAAELEPGRPFADAELDASVRDEIEHPETFGRARRMVVARDHLPDAVPDPNRLRPRRRRREKHLGRRAMRVLFEKVVLDAPRVVEAQSIGERDLLQRLVHHALLRPLVPRLRHLQLVKHPESHAGVVARGT